MNLFSSNKDEGVLEKSVLKFLLFVVFTVTVLFFLRFVDLDKRRVDVAEREFLLSKDVLQHLRNKEGNYLFGFDVPVVANFDGTLTVSLTFNIGTDGTIAFFLSNIFNG